MQIQARQMNETQTTMIQQLNKLNYMWRGEFGVKMIVIMDENTLRFPMQIGRKKVNVDLKYESGDDLYSVKAYNITAFTAKTMNFKGTLTAEDWDQFTRDTTIYDSDGLYWDQLMDVCRSIASKLDG